MLGYSYFYCWWTKRVANDWRCALGSVVAYSLDGAAIAAFFAVGLIPVATPVADEKSEDTFLTALLFVLRLNFNSFLKFFDFYFC